MAENASTRLDAVLRVKTRTRVSETMSNLSHHKRLSVSMASTPGKLTQGARDLLAASNSYNVTQSMKIPGLDDLQV